MAEPSAGNPTKMFFGVSQVVLGCDPRLHLLNPVEFAALDLFP